MRALALIARIESARVAIVAIDVNAAFPDRVARSRGVGNNLGVFSIFGAAVIVTAAYSDETRAKPQRDGNPYIN
jgi:hypothetical protein